MFMYVCGVFVKTQSRDERRLRKIEGKECVEWWKSTFFFLGVRLAAGKFLKLTIIDSDPS
jgi:hypothetical protein